MPRWLVGFREYGSTEAFIEDLAGRLANRVQLTLDGFESAGRDSAQATTQDQSKRVKDRIEKTRGAFARFSEQPAVQTLLLQFGGYSGVQLIQYVLANLGL